MSSNISTDKESLQLFTSDGEFSDESVKLLIEKTISVTGKDFFKILVKNLSEVLGVNYVFVSKCLNLEKTRVKTLAFWENNKFGKELEYDLEGTPCRNVISGKFCCHDDNVISLYPNDKDLIYYNAKCYLGIPIYNSKSLVEGHLAIFHDESFKDISRYYSILQIFALRAGAEMERIEIENSLNQSHAKLGKAFEEIEKLKDQLEMENQSLQEEIKESHNYEEIIGDSKVLKNVLSKVELVSDTDSTVLIRGDTGTGKERIARAIHNLSSRSKRALIKVNCPAIPSALIESELFGHEKGAFTGALAKKIGKFELADGGSIFLDELGDLPLDAQAKLLRVLQEREFERVGGTETLNVDVRIIAATNRDLETAVKDGKFRADLYYRLNVFPIDVPRLEERKEDIQLLATYFTQKYARKIGRKVKSIKEKDIMRLKSYSWPGNIRELENIIERAVILSKGQNLEISEDFFSALSDAPGLEARSLKLDDNERNHIINILNKTKWRIHGDKGAAKILGINPNTLRSRIVKLGIKKEEL